MFSLRLLFSLVLIVPVCSAYSQDRVRLIKFEEFSGFLVIKEDSFLFLHGPTFYYDSTIQAAMGDDEVIIMLTSDNAYNPESVHKRVIDTVVTIRLSSTKVINEILSKENAYKIFDRTLYLCHQRLAYIRVYTSKKIFAAELIFGDDKYFGALMDFFSNQYFPDGMEPVFEKLKKLYHQNWL